MKQIFNIEIATILSREICGENSLYIEAYAPDAGLIRAMKKISLKKTSQLPDIFDDISAAFEADSPTSLKFMRDFEILKRRTSIAESYECFSHAAKLCECVLKNGSNVENSTLFFGRLKKSLDALEKKSPPSIVRMKFLYLFARDEGYAIREDFYAKLSAPKQTLFAAIIKTPSPELKDFESRAEELLESMSEWIAINTDIIP